MPEWSFIECRCAVRARALLASWLERRRQRRLLAGMTRYMLDDIGLTPDEARGAIDGSLFRDQRPVV